MKKEIFLTRYLPAATALLVFIAIKWWYADTVTSNVLFILKPVATLTGGLLQQQPVYVAGNGYWLPESQVIINRSCSGMNYGLILFLLFYYQLQRSKKLHLITNLLLALIAAYCFTILLNAMRIAASVVLEASAISNLFSRHFLHQFTGTAHHIVSLVLLYFITEKLRLKSSSYAKPA